MKIIHIVEPFAAGLVTFIRSLTEDRPDDCQIVIHGERKRVMPAEEVKKLLPDGIKYIKWKNSTREISFKNDLLASIELFTILKKHRRDVDIVHLHSSKAGFIGRLICFFLRIRNVIYTPNGVSFINSDISRKKSVFYGLLEKSGSLLPGKIVSSSKSEQLTLMKRKIKSRLIYNGTKITDIDMNIVKNRYDKNKFVVATCGRIAPQKSPNMFNYIASQFISNDNIEFVWIGDGVEREKLTSENIRVTGWLSSEEVENELKNASLYISTARWEGLPFSVLEAMNLGLPLLLSDCVGNLDLIIDDVNGYSFSEAEEAVNLINIVRFNPISLYYMGLNSREICNKKFRVENLAKAYRRLYFKIAFNKNINETKAEHLNLMRKEIHIEDYKYERHENRQK